MSTPWMFALGVCMTEQCVDITMQGAVLPWACWCMVHLPMRHHVIPKPCVSNKWMRKPACCFPAERTGVFFACYSCYCEHCLVCFYPCAMCFHSLWADIFTNCFVAWAFWPISTWITHFVHISSIHVNMITVCECVCVVPCLRLCAALKKIVYTSPPPPPNVILLPLGPWQTDQTGRK